MYSLPEIIQFQAFKSKSSKAVLCSTYYFVDREVLSGKLLIIADKGIKYWFLVWHNRLKLPIFSARSLSCSLSLFFFS